MGGSLVASSDGARRAVSASARARVKSPESRIAFPLTDLRARPQDELAPLHRGTAQAERHEVPTAPTFHPATRGGRQSPAHWTIELARSRIRMPSR
jgi:hypothetical protein